MADAYRFYAGRTVDPVRVVWNAKRSISDITPVVFSANLSNGTLTSTHDSSQLWAAVSKRVDPSGTTFSVDAAAKPAEALRVTATLTGTDANTVLVLQDAQGLSDLVSTAAYVTLESKGLVFWWTRWDADVPADQIEVLSPSQIVIHVGRFWPSANMADLKPGKEVRVTLTIQRRLGDDGGAEAPVTIRKKLSKE
jgi:hypothetical protein